MCEVCLGATAITVHIQSGPAPCDQAVNCPVTASCFLVKGPQLIVNGSRTGQTHLSPLLIPSSCSGGSQDSCVEASASVHGCTGARVRVEEACEPMNLYTCVCVSVHVRETKAWRLDWKPAGKTLDERQCASALSP